MAYGREQILLMICLILVNRRIEYAKEHGARIASKGKNDTVIARPLVVQLDSDAIVQHNDTWVWDVMSIIEEMFGKEKYYWILHPQR